MTKEQIEKKITEYKQQQQQLKNNLIAYDGAIQALEGLLVEEKKEAKLPDDEKKQKPITK